MKTLLKISVVPIILMFLVITGCSKPPTEELNAAKAAIDAAVSAGADKFAQEDLKKLNDDLQAANKEIEAKEYKKAKEMLVKLKADAEALKAAIPEKKEKAKQNALTAEEEAKKAVEEAKSLLEKAPKGKGTKADIEAMKADLKGLEDSLAEIKSLIDGENYSGAIEKANSIKEKAGNVANQIKEALEKVGAKKAEAPKSEAAPGKK
jgi:DNA repair exonuclease SbcCD ATPase subunit